MGDLFMEERENHSLSLLNREDMKLSGIKDVDSFNETEIIAVTAYGDLSIRGDMLHVEELNLDTGDMKISGKVDALVYTDTKKGSGIFKRLFGG